LMLEYFTFTQLLTCWMLTMIQCTHVYDISLYKGKELMAPPHLSPYLVSI
jgi:hypothetical protein